MIISQKNVVRSLYPELFGAQRSASAPTMTGLSEAAKLQMEMSGNTLNPTGADLWAVVADQYVDKFTKKYGDISLLSYKCESNIAVPQGVRPTINVEVVETAGEPLVNATNWQETALKNTYAEVKADRISRPAGLSTGEMANGAVWSGKIEAAVQSVIGGVFAKLAAAIAAVTPEAAAAPSATKAGRIALNPAEFTPEFIAQTISTLFGDAGQPDVMYMTNSLWGRIARTTELSLNPGAENVYNVGKLAMSAGMAGLTADNKGLAVALQRSGIAAGVGLPALPSELGIAVRSLGTICGVPLLLKAWADAGTETIWQSVETYAGFTVVDPSRVAVVATA